MPDGSATDREPADASLYAIALACTRGREAIVVHFRDLLRDNGLTEQQWRVMRALYEAETLTTPELCARCCLHKVSMMRILRSLTERKLAQRAPVENDRRRHVIRITPAGQELIAGMMPRARAIYDDILDRLGRDKAARLANLLGELAQINIDPATARRE